MRILHLANHVDNVGNGIVNIAVDLAWYQAERGHDVAFASAGGAFVELLARGGVRHFELSGGEGSQDRPLRRKEPLSVLREAWSLRRVLADFNPDAVHAHMVTGALLARAVKARFAFTLVCSVQNEWQRHATLMRVGDAVVAVSDANRRSLEARGIPRSKLHLVRNGTLGSPRLGDSDGAVDLRHPAITCVAGLFERKGIPELVTAFERLPESLGAHLYLVGEGWYRDELEARVQESPAGDRVHIEGFRPDPVPYLRATDLFVLASRKDPFPVVLSEARAAGCAIIGTDVDGIPEALEGGRAGALVPVGDTTALSDRMRELLEDEGERRRLAEAAQANLDWLSAAHMADRMLAVYDAARARPMSPGVEMLRHRVGHARRHPLQSAVRVASHALVRAQTSGRVVDGPFAGMWYGLMVPHLPAYLGTYELELGPLLAELADISFDVVLNVGAADGYYAAGLSRLWPAAQVVAFELMPAKQANVRRVATENGVDRRVRIEGVCTPGRLDELTRAAERPLVWMDVDGAELELLDPELAPGLRRAEIVVELHEFLVPRLRETLEARFVSTHLTRLVPGEERHVEQFPLDGRLWRTPLGHAVALEAMQERRPVRQAWLHLRPRAVQSATTSA
jgi:glycosyltransferase involved in cell wall biosynthesis